MMATARPEKAADDLTLRWGVAGLGWVVEMLALASSGEVPGSALLTWAVIAALPFALYVGFVQTPQGSRLYGTALLLVLVVMYLVMYVQSPDGGYTAIAFVFFAQPVLYVAAPLFAFGDWRMRRAKDRRADGRASPTP